MADYSGVHTSHSPYLRVPGDVNRQCGKHPDSFCASNDWGTGLHQTSRRIAEAYVAAYFRLNGRLCGAVNPDYPTEYFCSFEVGHGPIPEKDFDPEDGESDAFWDHASPEFGAAWNVVKPTSQPVRLPWGGVTIAPRPKEKPVTILDAQTLKLISTVLEALNSFNGEEWPDVYLTVDLKHKSGDRIGAFTDEYGDWVFETAADEA
jgi:hypothetical protein